MSFINFPVFAIGSLLIAAPIALHLMMRQKPQHAMFPALRFVRQRQVVNQQRIRLRHWALLALRCAVVLGLAAALARPIVASAVAGGWWMAGLVGLVGLVVGGLAITQWQRAPGAALSWVLAVVALLLLLLLGWLLFRVTTVPEAALPAGDSEEPLAAVMIFDTSPRMGFVQDNQSRLAMAQELGRSLLKQLPRDSEIAVINTMQTGEAFSIDRAAAMSQVNSLKPSFATDDLPETIGRALDLLESSERERRELYVFTDLTTASWPGATPAVDAANSLSHRIAERLNADQEMRPSVYVIDVGSEAPSNLSLGEVRLSRQHLPPKSTLKLQVEILSQGLAGTRQVELYIEKPDPDLPIIVDGKPQLPEPILRGKREVTIAADESQWLDFAVRGLSEGTHHGEIRIVGEDGLQADDIRYFAVDVHAAARVLVVSGPGAEPRFVENALAPLELKQAGEAVFQTQIARPEQLPEVDFTPFAAVVLLDPPPLPPVVWRDLTDYVRRGGGLATFVGRNANDKGKSLFAPPEAMEVLPAELERVWRDPDGVALTMRENSHPILRVLQSNVTSIPWSEFSINRHWLAKPVADGGHVVLRYGNGKPALLERNLGDGRSLLFTAPVSDPLNVRGRSPWTIGTDSWPYLVLVNETVKYAASGAESPLNYLVGQIAGLPQSKDDPERMQMFQPQGSWQEVVARSRRLEVPFTDVPGAYRLKSPPPSKQTRGFAVNLAAESTRLDRIAPASLDQIFGSSNYQLARDEDSIERELGVARKGYEFYPWMMLVVVGVLALEHLLSNRFYGSQAKAESAHQKRASSREAASKMKESISGV